eukprot:scaffold83967_cov58-Attheya_sp.AAC.2
MISRIRKNVSMIASYHANKRRDAGRPKYVGACSSSVSPNESEIAARSSSSLDRKREIVIHWRGEGVVEGYTIQFRKLELQSALSAVSPDLEGKMEDLEFTNALSYDFDDRDVHPEKELLLYESGLQFMTGSSTQLISSQVLTQAATRCSLIRAVYEIVCEADTYKELSEQAVEKGTLADVMVGGVNQNDTWCVRLRQFGSASADSPSAVRYGKSKRSPLRLEREAISLMDPLFSRMGGRVKLEDPDCKLNIFEGLIGKQKILARTIASGIKTSVIRPASRICITNTPLCNVAAFCMGNIAQIQNDQTVLDPFAGSCTTLLVAAMLAPGCKTVGIELAPNYTVNRDDIRRDFSSRQLTQPVALIEGDSTCEKIRTEARAAVGGVAFDVIIADPPYGIRERMDAQEPPPLVKLVSIIARDYETGTPLLAKNGRLVAFVPNQLGEDLSLSMPTPRQLEDAGLKMTALREQPLSDVLSRWLVAYKSIR